MAKKSNNPPDNSTTDQSSTPPVRYARGLRLPANLTQLRRSKAGIRPEGGGDIPERYDSREHGWVGPIKNQRQCGSCWDFAGTGLVEIALRKAGLLKLEETLSEQYTLDCVRSGGCEGDDHSTVLDECKRHGLPLEKDYGPYQGREGRCGSDRVTDWHKIPDWGYCDGGQGGEHPTREQIQRGILRCGGASVAVAAGPDWDGHRGEIMRGRNRGINHEVIIVGWEPDPEIRGQVVWTVRNHWGPEWADDGYCRMAEGADEIGAYAVFVAIDAPTPPPPPPTPSGSSTWSMKDDTGATLTIKLAREEGSVKVQRPQGQNVSGGVGPAVGSQIPPELMRHIEERATAGGWQDVLAQLMTLAPQLAAFVVNLLALFQGQRQESGKGGVDSQGKGGVIHPTPGESNDEQRESGADRPSDAGSAGGTRPEDRQSQRNDQSGPVGPVGVDQGRNPRPAEVAPQVELPGEEGEAGQEGSGGDTRHVQPRRRPRPPRE